jgi:hypothetical protein
MDSNDFPADTPREAEERRVIREMASGCRARKLYALASDLEWLANRPSVPTTDALHDVLFQHKKIRYQVGNPSFKPRVLTRDLGPTDKLSNDQYDLLKIALTFD